MTTRNLDALFHPQAIALIGASNQPNSVGAVLARNLQSGGFSGPILAVNPHERAIGSTLSYRSVADLPITPDVAVLATPPATIPGLIADLGARGCRAAVVVTAGFGEGGREAGEALRLEMLKAAQPHLLRIVGPNCLGFMSPHVGINASFAQVAPTRGDVAFLSQSGALVTAVLDWASGRGLGFSHVVSLGDMSDVDFGDLLDHLAQDAATRSILLYIESIADARKFMSAARIAARAKPVIAIKAGRSQSGAKAALSHTGALAGADAVYDAAFRRAGMLRVYELREIFEAAETLARKLQPRGDRLSILTNGGGAGVLAADALDARGGRLAGLPADIEARLDAVLPAAWSGANPIDIIGDASGERYAQALNILMANPDQDAILVMNCPTGVVAPDEASAAVLDSVKAKGAPPVLTCWLGEATARVARRQFEQAGLATYETPDDAVRAFMHLVDYRRNQELLLETPAAGVTIAAEARESAKAVVNGVLAEGRTVLSEAESKRLLALYGVPVVQTYPAKDAADAVRIAGEIGGPCALKILSPDITHKSDVGGVRLGLRDSAEVAAAARSILDQVALQAPAARIEGFTVEPMVVRHGAIELITGIMDDSVFGPVVLFGQGGTAVEVLADRALGLPPLNAALAGDMIARTRVARLLKGYRDVAPADMSAIEAVLTRLADLAIDMPEIAELDINPLLADADGVVALDARVVVRSMPAKPRRLAIKPYPAELEKDVIIRDGRRLHIRPIRPEDEPALVEMGRRSTPNDMRLRFFGGLRSIPHALAARLSQIDYDREMALVAIESVAPDHPAEILGVVRLIGDPDNVRGEFAIMVRSDLKGHGLGHALMWEMLALAEARGLSHVRGDVLPDNATMLQMARELGAACSALDSDGRTLEVSFDLPLRGAGANVAGEEAEAAPATS